MHSSRTSPQHSSPPLSLLFSEPARAFVDFLGSHLQAARSEAGDGHTVIVYPGLGAGPWSTTRLRAGLDAAGFHSLDWGFGNNHGPRGRPEVWLERLADAAASASDEHGSKVSLVGWSLGGIYAREIARAVPASVRQVITLGSPFAAPPDATHAAWLYRLLSGSHPPRSGRYVEGLKEALPVPSTSIYSKADGIVPWQGCMQEQGPLSENIEVPGVSHLGMGTNRSVLGLVTERLAQREGQWARYRPRAPPDGPPAPEYSS
ncbi:MAG: alpha/beta fold hydrolase [Caldimonas sp.]